MPARDPQRDCSREMPVRLTETCQKSIPGIQNTSMVFSTPEKVIHHPNEPQHIPRYLLSLSKPLPRTTSTTHAQQTSGCDGIGHGRCVTLDCGARLAVSARLQRWVAARKSASCHEWKVKSACRWPPLVYDDLHRACECKEAMASRGGLPSPLISDSNLLPRLLQAWVGVGIRQPWLTELEAGRSELPFDEITFTSHWLISTCCWTGSRSRCTLVRRMGSIS